MSEPIHKKVSIKIRGREEYEVKPRQPIRNEEIRRRHRSGESVKALALAFGLSSKRIRDILVQTDFVQTQKRRWPSF